MKLLPKLKHALARLRWRVLRPLTVGVRVLLIQDDTILLIKHTYLESWYLPGGGVKKGETIEAALRREVGEEIGAQLGSLALLGIYSSFGEYKSDHSIIFVCQDFTVTGKTDNEIAKWGFFPLGDLPSNTSPATRRRIEEYLAGTGVPTVGEW